MHAILEDLVYGALLLEDDDGGLDDVLVDGGFGTLMIWRQFLFYILPIRWSLPHLRVEFLKPLLVGSKRTLAGSSKKSWNSYFSWS